MSKIALFYVGLLFSGFNLADRSGGERDNAHTSARFDTLNKVISPQELKLTYFSGPDLTPSPACIAAAATGEVFVGVDMIGSLGKRPGRGSIVKLTDTDNDGKADQHTTFAVVDKPAGHPSDRR